MPFEEAASDEYGSIRAYLEKKGQMIGGNDLLIAAHAKSLDLVLVTTTCANSSECRGLRSNCGLKDQRESIVKESIS